jgi:polyhydroxyalkanoate synthesis regulator phasin
MGAIVTLPLDHPDWLCPLRLRGMAKRKGTRADALRTAVDQTFHAAAGQAQLTRDRAQEVVDELSHTATRVRDLLDDLRPPSGDEIRSLRDDLRALERRVAKLEARGKEAGKAKRPARGG